jgi:hypothetical protein
MRKVLSTVAAAMLVGATTLSAQNVTDEAAYLAIESSPLGSLPARLSAPMMSQSANKMTLAVQYGFLGLDADQAINNFGAQIETAWHGSRVGFTFAYASPSCPGGTCDGYIQAGANWGRRLTSVVTGQGADAARLNIGMEGDVNYGKPTDATALAASFGLPIAFVPNTRGVQVVPFLTPRYAVGQYHVSGGTGDTGSELMLGGGFAINGLMEQIGLNFGFQKVFIEDGKTMIGAALTFRVP